MSSIDPPPQTHPVRTALAATAVVGILLVALCASVDLIVVHNLRAAAEANLTSTLAHRATQAAQRPLPEPDLDEPVVTWLVSSAGTVIDASPGAPPLPATLAHAGAPQEASIAGTTFLIAGAALPAGRVVVGRSLASVGRATSTIVIAELVIAPVLLAAVFGGALLVGRRATASIQRARRRQLAFTADASHELRAPLSVIEAEASLALSRPHDATASSLTLRRVLAESRVMQRMINDMLWLARFDSSQPSPRSETVDLGTAVKMAGARFQAVAAQRGIRLEVRAADAALLQAPPEWIDRVVGVLLDNACKYAAAGGVVRVSADCAGGTSRLTVEDDGPGIPARVRSRIADRVHRETSDSNGTGLGLAIGDAVVRATHGQWEIGESPLGGARMSVIWSAAPRPGGRT